MQPHFMIADGGDLFDTRTPDWFKSPALRPGFSCHHVQIDTVAEYKATLRAGPSAWPGCYPLYLLCSDGAALCFDCGRKNARLIFESIQQRSNDGWRVVACDVNHETADLYCENCNAHIEPSCGIEAES